MRCRPLAAPMDEHITASESPPPAVETRHFGVPRVGPARPLRTHLAGAATDDPGTDAL